jgi:ADP-ribosylglycohydrolase
MGKIVGIRLGSAMEGWSHERIAETYGTIEDYVQDYHDYAADDDSNGPLFFVRALMDDPGLGTGITADRMGETWLNYVADGHGFFWWGGYGVSTEHTAYENLKAGIRAPVSGSAALNGTTVSNQIGGQIFIDSWGFVFPADPAKAANVAARMIQVSHDGEGLYGGMFVTGCISAAYVASSVDEIIAGGLSVIPAHCEVRSIVEDLQRFRKEDAAKDWRACLAYVQQRYGYDRYPGTCHILPNLAVVVLSLLYGNGDFSRSLSICTTCGWDTDCNSGNLGSILGVFVGIEGIEERWTDPIGDLLLASSAIGNLNITTVSRSACEFAALGCKLAGKQLPEPFAGRTSMLAFDLPRSTGAFRTDQAGTVIRNCEESAMPGHRSLLVAREAGGSLDLFHKTYYRPSDLEDSRYDPAFSPVVFPGQVVSFQVKNTSCCTLSAHAYVVDCHDDLRSEGPANPIGPGETATVSYEIPAGSDILVCRVGLVAVPMVQGVRTSLLVDHMAIEGQPDYRIRFDKEQVEVYSLDHRELGPCTYSGGSWEYRGAYLTGSSATVGNLLFGFYRSEDASYSVLVTPLFGHHHLVSFRVQGLARSYSFGFCGPDRIALLKREGTDDRIIQEKEFRYEPNVEYRFAVVAEGGRLTCSVDGEVQFSWTDDRPYSYGQMGMVVKHGSRCRYREVVIHRI